MISARTTSAWMCSIIAFALFVGFAGAEPAPLTSAQTVDWRLPLTPGPSECTVARRTLNEIEGIVAGLILPGGSTSMPSAETAEIEAEIVDTVVQSAACVNANLPLAWLALVSDNYLVEHFGQGAPDALASLKASLTRQPAVAAQDDRLTVEAIELIDMLGDGRATAEVTTSSSDARFTDQLIFVWQDDRWLIDEIVQLGGTPVATE